MKYSWGTSELARHCMNPISQLALEDEGKAAVRVMEEAVDLTIAEFKDPLRVSKNWELLKEFAQVADNLEQKWRSDLKALLIIKKLAQTNFKGGNWLAAAKAEKRDIIDIDVDHDED